MNPDMRIAPLQKEEFNVPNEPSGNGPNFGLDGRIRFGEIPFRNRDRDYFPLLVREKTQKNAMVDTPNLLRFADMRQAELDYISASGRTTLCVVSPTAQLPQRKEIAWRRVVAGRTVSFKEKRRRTNDGVVADSNEQCFSGDNSMMIWIFMLVSDASHKSPVRQFSRNGGEQRARLIVPSMEAICCPIKKLLKGWKFLWNRHFAEMSESNLFLFYPVVKDASGLFHDGSGRFFFCTLDREGNGMKIEDGHVVLQDW